MNGSKLRTDRRYLIVADGEVIFPIKKRRRRPQLRMGK